MLVVVQLLDLYCWIIIASAVVTWLPIPQDHPAIQVLNSMTEPVYAPIRTVLNPNKTGGMDLSPLVVLLGVQLLQAILIQDYS